MSKECYFCDEDNDAALEAHHIIPRRYGGGDQSENLVVVCANCHRKLEALYDDEFYSKLGVDVSDTPRDDGDEVAPEDALPRHERRKKAIKHAIAEQAADRNGASINAVVEAVNFDNRKAEREIEKLKERGELYAPEQDKIRLIDFDPGMPWCPQCELYLSEDGRCERCGTPAVQREVSTDD